jgi:hypothetical protein
VCRFFPIDRRPSWRRVLRIRLLGEAVGTVTRTGSFGAEPARAWMLADHAGTGRHGYEAAASELIVNSCASATVSLAVAGAVLLRSDAEGPLRILCHILCWSSLVYMSVIVAALAARLYPIGAVLRGIGALPVVGRWLKTDAVRVRTIEDAIKHALTDRPSVLARIVCLEFLAQLILITEIYWTIHSMGFAITPARALYFEVLTKVPNVIQFIGVTEAAYAVVFNWLGMTATLGFALSIVKLLRSVTAAAIGLLILGRLDRVLVPPLTAAGWTRRPDIERELA